ncbi:hypothetical protein BGW36DRAFT_425031 [Talaromyces proteolyticus]|uniref:Helix-turn-helix domain-containing protein n=1 Tax=Talaromyces proteolyticus TaxID=1131652 RepID=A0AAD4KSN8_9EURO|nr:uncharacterized protein BGW36DRAFT_425031 [Talaromyces proteolyticus]KAH8700198.1 hypothetical protein BGW36DRAFT_425031 [Talaromyces proteolyticus]
MGASASKPARSAAAAASRRQFPKRPSEATTTTPSPAQQHQPTRTSTGPTYHSNEEPSSLRSEAIDLDARDPHFAASLRSIGPVTPNPTMSNSSTFNSSTPLTTTSPSVFPDANNPALLVLSSRTRITKAAEQEQEVFGRQSHQGREFLDVLTIRQALQMRDRQGLSMAEIERLLRLKKGVMLRLGERGLVSEAA